MKVNITIDISEEDVIDALITALEGGSNYWYYIPHVPHNDLKDMYHHPCLSERIALATIEGYVVLDIYDIEDPTVELGKLSRESIQRGLRLYAAKHQGFDIEYMDASAADELFQYIVMGEVLFG